MQFLNDFWRLEDLKRDLFKKFGDLYGKKSNVRFTHDITF